MLGILKKILVTGRVTNEYPSTKDQTPARLRGKPSVNPELCTFCGACAFSCPTGAITDEAARLDLAYEKCIFCGHCQEACPFEAIKLSGGFELAARAKEDLHWTLIKEEGIGQPELPTPELTKLLGNKIKKVLGQSLHIRHVDAGSCNGCDWDMSALLNPVYDLQRLGIDFVASPRHADMLLVTGPVTRHLEQALLETYQATPDPKLVVAAGTCSCSGGIFNNGYTVIGGTDKVVPVDIYIPGCPPRPQAFIYGLLVALDRIEQQMKRQMVVKNRT